MVVAGGELFERFPDIEVDHDNKEHCRGLLEHRLLLNRCVACGTWHNPPVPMCPRCWSTDVVATEVQGTGTVYLLTIMHQGPVAPDVDYAQPYPVASVELDEQRGLRFTAGVRVEPGAMPSIGDRVHLVWGERFGHPLPMFEVGDVLR